MRRSALPHRLPAALVAGLLAMLAGAVWFVPPAFAEDAVIEVAHGEEGSLHPADVTIHPGDTVTWRWTANEHHRIAFDEGLPESATTSGNPECQPVDLPPEFGGRDCTGHEYAVTFEEPGAHAYGDEQRLGSEGSVTVEPAPSPSPTGSDSPSPTSSPSPSPTGTDSGSPTPTPSPEPSSPTPDEEEAPESSQPRQTSTQSVPSGGAEEPSDAPSPQVATASPSDTPTEADETATDEPTFDDFPEPEEPTPATEDVLGEVAVGGDDDGGISRVAWGALGGVTVLGTLGAFVRVVVLGDPGPPA